MMFSIRHTSAKVLAAAALMLVMGAVTAVQSQTAYTIRGIIMIPTNHHDENFEVLLTTKDGEQIIAFTNADISSRYSFSNLTAGYFDVVIRLHGFKESRTHFRTGFEEQLGPTGAPGIAYDVNIMLTPEDTPGEVAAEHLKYTKELLDEYGKGLEQVTKKHPDLALPHLEKVVMELPDFYDGHFNLGLVYQDLSRRRDAEKEFRRAHELNPESARPLMVLGRLFLEEADIEVKAATKPEVLAGKLDSAREALTEAIRLDPKLAQAFYCLGAVEFLAKSYADSEKALKRALELDSKMFEARIMLINVFVDQKKWGPALDNADNFLLENPTSPYRTQVITTRQSIVRRLQSQ